MTVNWRRRSLLVSSALAVGILATACSSATSTQREPGAVGSSAASAAAIGVQTTPSFIAIENRAGLPLVDVEIALQSTTGLSFSMSVPRFESGERREIALGNLRSRDGTSFSPVWQRPKAVVVTAKDVVGKKYDLTLPWK